METSVPGWPKASACSSIKGLEYKGHLDRLSSLQAQTEKGQRGRGGDLASLAPGVIGSRPAYGPTRRTTMLTRVFTIKEGETSSQEGWLDGPSKANKN